MHRLFAVPLSVTLHGAGAALIAFAALSSPDPPPWVLAPASPVLPAGIVARLPSTGAARLVTGPRPSRSPRAPFPPTLAVPAAVPDLSDALAGSDMDLGADVSIPCLADCHAGVAGDPGGAEPAASATPPAAVRAGGDIRAPLKLRHVAPAYPDLARIARIEGDVVLECTISPEGRVVDVRVLSGPPLLRDAAEQAVQQWLYRPTLLNGVAVPVIMTVTVHFTLSR